MARLRPCHGGATRRPPGVLSVLAEREVRGAARGHQVGRAKVEVVGERGAGGMARQGEEACLVARGERQLGEGLAADGGRGGIAGVVGGVDRLVLDLEIQGVAIRAILMEAELRAQSGRGGRSGRVLRAGRRPRRRSC